MRDQARALWSDMLSDIMMTSLLLVGCLLVAGKGWVGMEVRGQCQVFSSINSPPYFWRKGLSQNLKLTGRLASKQFPKILLSPHSKDWDGRHVATMSGFHVDAGDLKYAIVLKHSLNAYTDSSEIHYVAHATPNGGTCPTSACLVLILPLLWVTLALNVLWIFWKHMWTYVSACISLCLRSLRPWMEENNYPQLESGSP